MRKKQCIAMLLAGGQGSRLTALTKNMAKPAVSFGGKYRMIDFSLSNCANSHIDTVGVLTQYKPFKLNAYIQNGRFWDLNDREGGVFILPPYATETGGSWYNGTADAIYRNLDFLDMYDSEYVLILSGDHLYKMNYKKMLDAHIANDADATISVMQVPWEDVKRFGTLEVDDTDRITKFVEKDPKSKSNLASMGIYIFTTKLLKKALIEDSKNKDSEHDFGKNIIPKMIEDGKKLYCYRFNGFWRDVGTIKSYYETSMDLLNDESEIDLFKSDEFKIMSNSIIYAPGYIGDEASVDNCIIANACQVLGSAENSILSNGVIIEKKAKVINSILLPGAKVESGAVVQKAIIGENAIIKSKCKLGSNKKDAEISVLGNDCVYQGGDL